MQDWPLLRQRATAATRAAAGRSAEGITTNGSLPPSSSTTFLISLPAMAATDCPAGPDPVSVAATTRLSRSTGSIRAEPTSRVWKVPCGNPARANRSCMNSAVCGTFEACLRRPALPAIRSISVVIIAAIWSCSSSRMSAARRIHPAWASKLVRR